MQTDDDDDEVCSDGMCYFSCWTDDDECDSSCEDALDDLTELRLISHILTDENI